MFCTPGTQDLCSLVLPDSAHIQEEDARDANRHGYSKHHPALPLYTSTDAARALTQLQPVGLRPAGSGRAGHRGRVPPTAGHLLGSAYARVRLRRAKRSCSAATSAVTAVRSCPIRSPVDAADVLLVESTYGDRLHEPRRRRQSPGGDRQRHRRAGREADHPGVRHRPRRGSDLLAEAARGRTADSDPAGLRRQPDGRTRAAVLREPDRRARRRHGARPRRV